ncbi:hypothetical protein PHYPSEUDO_014086 [Phytophthora pseudosyringae]|uniref:M96 mating-specific protein family n=1 Tax=Phytophthora pseudosyringae TaxID=221518 RepID=A0A8T1V574_9STRA|nr:hypothetical protein PHYPSEUDO_014086 [Phytophthora pseudosyringae]
MSLSTPSDLLLHLSSDDVSVKSPLPDASMDLSTLNSPLLDDVPTLDDLLLPEDDEFDVNSLYKPPLNRGNELPVELDPTLLFPEPVELLAVVSEPLSSQSSPDGPISSPTSDAQTSPDAMTITLPVAAPPRRKRRKDELDCLRVKATELEEQLQQLQKRDDGAEEGEEEQAETEREGPGVSVWRKVARRQLEGKKRAQRENEKLRDMVEGQLTIVQNLEKLLRKRSALEESGAWASERKRLRVDFEAENAVFDRLLNQLDEQFKETDAAFRQNDFARKKTDGQHMQVRPDGVYGMFMEFLASKVLPFELHTTATQFWRCMAQPHLKLRDGHYSLIDGSEDTLSAKMAFTVQHNKHQVLKDAWFAVKRYVEEDRCVFVWACETKVKGTLSSAQSMRHRDTGWTLVDRHNSGTVEDSLESCIIQTCVRVRTELPEVMPRSQEELMLLTDIVTSSFLENLEGIHQSVEDALIEEAIRSS